MTIARNDPHWRTSSFSGNNTNCVQVHRSCAVVRDSKNVDGPSLAGDVASLVAAIKGGRLN